MLSEASGDVAVVGFDHQYVGEEVGPYVDRRLLSDVPLSQEELVTAAWPSTRRLAACHLRVRQGRIHHVHGQSPAIEDEGLLHGRERFSRRPPGPRL